MFYISLWRVTSAYVNANEMPILWDLNLIVRVRCFAVFRFFVIYLLEINQLLWGDVVKKKMHFYFCCCFYDHGKYCAGHYWIYLFIVTWNSFLFNNDNICFAWNRQYYATSHCDICWYRHRMKYISLLFNVMIN